MQKLYCEKKAGIYVMYAMVTLNMVAADAECVR